MTIASGFSIESNASRLSFGSQEGLGLLQRTNLSRGGATSLAVTATRSSASGHRSSPPLASQVASEQRRQTAVIFVGMDKMFTVRTHDVEQCMQPVECDLPGVYGVPVDFTDSDQAVATLNLLVPVVVERSTLRNSTGSDHRGVSQAADNTCR